MESPGGKTAKEEDTKRYLPLLWLPAAVVVRKSVFFIAFSMNRREHICSDYLFSAASICKIL